LTVVLTGFGLTIYQLERMKRLSAIDGELEIRVSFLNRALRESPITRGEGPPELRPRPAGLDLPPEAAALFDSSYYYAVWYHDGTLIKRSASLPDEGDSPSDLDRDTLTHWRTRQSYREAFHCSGFGDCVLAGRSIQTDLANLTNFGFVLLAAGSAVLALGLTLGWRITMSVIRPIEQISAAANRISEGNLNERIPLASRRDELGSLAGVLNRTFARLESAFVRQRQFTADAAHELRTPLAVLITDAQTTLAHQRTAEDYRETIEGCLETAQQMRRLTDSLLELARFDSGGEPLPRAPFDLADLTQECLETVRPLATRHGVRVHAHLSPCPVFAPVEPLRQVAMNLLTNAIRYNKSDGEIRISTRMDASSAVLSVTDSGIGIPAADLPHIFDRFYRVDKSRSRQQGGTGLGLAICKSIVDAERGKIEVASIPGEGTTVIVTFPVTSIS
jgi:heavy metal sensor kinase